MEQPINPDPPSTSWPTDGARTPRFRAVAATVVLVGVGLLVWLVLRDTGGGSSNPTSDGATVSAASEQQLRSLASSVGHQIYWVGAKPGYTYELTKKPDGSILIRYLPAGVKVGDSRAHLTVATYPVRNALGAIESVKGSNIVSFTIPNGGAAEYTKSYPESVHLAYPGSDYQVEVYDPSPAAARQIVTSGQLTTIG